MIIYCLKQFILHLFYFIISGVLGPNVGGVAKRFTTRTLFAKHVIKCTTFVALLVLCAANNCRRVKFFICNPEKRVLYARITTSTKVRQSLKLYTFLIVQAYLHRNSPSVFSMIVALSWMSLKFKYYQKAQKK